MTDAHQRSWMRSGAKVFWRVRPFMGEMVQQDRKQREDWCRSPPQEYSPDGRTEWLRIFRKAKYMLKLSLHFSFLKVPYYTHFQVLIFQPGLQRRNLSWLMIQKIYKSPEPSIFSPPFTGSWLEVQIENCVQIYSPLLKKKTKLLLGRAHVVHSIPESLILESPLSVAFVTKNRCVPQHTLSEGVEWANSRGSSLTG